MIKIDNLSFRYPPDKQALNKVSFTVHAGEWITILGHNGSGKSTLSKLLIGLLKAQEGTITIDDLVLSPETVHEIRKRIGIVFQNPDNQFVGVTVKDDIAFGLENLQIPREEMLERIEYYARKVGMEHVLEKEPSALSGGQKQRVAIAGVLAMRPATIIFDEATSMLDPEGRAMVMSSMRQLSQEGTTIINITHDLKEAVYSDRLIILKEGQVLAQGNPQTLLSDVTLLREARLDLLASLALKSALAKADLLDEPMERLLWELNLKM
jgi:energy-coupling factor transport system ATP-binding protein